MKGNIVKITLWDETVGYLQWDNTDWRTESSVFQFDKDFVESGLDISPLLMPLTAPAVRNALPIRGGSKKNDFKGLPAVFADSLPDHWGNSLFRAWARNEGIRMKETTPVDMLSFIGARGMGALEYEPARIDGERESFDVDVEKLYAFSSAVLKQRTEPVFDANEELLWMDLVKLGTSPGGKRPKALVAINPETNTVKSGQVSELPAGYEHYILKYDNEAGGFPYAKVEYVYYLMCRECGITMQDSYLKQFGHATHFLTKRFDRTASGKIHMQSLLAMSGGISSYDEAFDLLRHLGLQYGDFEQLFRRMVFNVLAGNIDDHARNFSFLMDKKGIWSLAPAYDVVFSIDPSLMYVQKGQSLGVCGKTQAITRADLMSIGQRYGIANAAGIIEQVTDIVSRVDSYCFEQDVDSSTRNMIARELNEKKSELDA